MDDNDTAVLNIKNGFMPEVDEVVQWFHTHKSVITSILKINEQSTTIRFAGIEIDGVYEKTIHFHPIIIVDSEQLDENEAMIIWSNVISKAVSEILVEFPMSNLSVEIW